MINLAAVFIGMSVALMVLANGQLGDALNPYRGTVLIHVIGLMVQSIIILIRKVDLRLRRGLPIFYYTGGAIGVLTVMFSMHAFARLGVAPVVALNLLGMTIASVLIDQIGLFDMPRYPMTKHKLLSIIFITGGVISLLMPVDVSAGMAILLALLAGVSIVVSRTLNARVLYFYNLHVSTLFNFITGLLTSFILLAVFAAPTILEPFTISSNWLMYTGGAIGAIMVSLTSYVVVRMSAYNVTVLMFLGQYFFGMLLDSLFGRLPTLQGILGGITILAGLLINYIDKRQQNTSSG